MDALADALGEALDGPRDQSPELRAPPSEQAMRQQLMALTPAQLARMTPEQQAQVQELRARLNTSGSERDADPLADEEAEQHAMRQQIMALTPAQLARMTPEHRAQVEQLRARLNLPSSELRNAEPQTDEHPPTEHTEEARVAPGGGMDASDGPMSELDVRKVMNAHKQLTQENRRLTAEHGQMRDEMKAVLRENGAAARTGAAKASAKQTSGSWSQLRDFCSALLGGILVSFLVAWAAFPIMRAMPPPYDGVQAVEMAPDSLARLQAPAPLSGKFAPNERLAAATRLFEGQVRTPAAQTVPWPHVHRTRLPQVSGVESVLVQPDGELLMFDKFGHLHRARKRMSFGPEDYAIGRRLSKVMAVERGGSRAALPIGTTPVYVGPGRPLGFHVRARPCVHLRHK